MRIFASALVAFSLVSCGQQMKSNSKLNNVARDEDDIVEFRIVDGTKDKAWNAEADQITLKIGQILRIINDDAVVHQLHTGGKPCQHGPAMAAHGGSYDCKIEKKYNRDTDGKLYDHNYGETAPFWIKVVEE